MANRSQDDVKPTGENERGEVASPRAEEVSAAKVEGAAQSLSKQDDALKGKQAGAESKSGDGGEKRDAEADEDPGLVVRMTAKGALSGF